MLLRNQVRDATLRETSTATGRRSNEPMGCGVSVTEAEDDGLPICRRPGATTWPRPGREWADTGIVQDMRDDHAAAVVAGIHAQGGSAEPMRGDITQLDRFLVSLNEMISSRAGIDILVNHAGISGLSTPLTDIDQDFFDRMMNVHVKGSFFITQAVVPEMKAKCYGKIINIASEFCLYGSPLASHYTAAKSALLPS